MKNQLWNLVFLRIRKWERDSRYAGFVAKKILKKNGEKAMEKSICKLKAESVSLSVCETNRNKD